MRIDFRRLINLTMLIIMLTAACGLIIFSGCESVRMAPSESQKQITHQAAITAHVVEAQGTEAHSPAAIQLAEATQISLQYAGLPKDPEIVDYPTTLATAQSDAARRPTADEIWTAADGWIDVGIAIAGLFGGGAGIAASQYLVKARQKSGALKEIIKANEELTKTLRDSGRTDELDAFYDIQNEHQSASTETIVAAERAKIKPPPAQKVKFELSSTGSQS